MTEDLGQIHNARGVDQDGSDSDSLSGGQESATLIGQAVVSVARPAPGQDLSIDAEAGQRYVIEFSPDAAQVRVQGNDLILTFADGASVTFENLGDVAGQPDAPVFEIAGQPISSTVIFGQAVALAGGEDAPTFETAAAPGVLVGTGETRYDDDTGDLIGLIDPQGVIPGTELEFRLIDLEPSQVLADETNPPVDFDVDVTAGFVDSLAAAGLTFAPGVGFGGGGGGAVAAVSAVGGSGTGGAIFVTGHDSEEHSNGEYMSAGLDFLAFGHEATGGEIAQRGSFTVAFLNPNTDNGAVSAMQAQGWNVTFFDLDNDFSPAFNGTFDLIMVGSGDGQVAHRDALFNAASDFEAFINGGGGLYVNTDEGFGQSWYDFVPNFGTTTNNTIGTSGIFTPTADGLAIGFSEAIVDRDITHSFFQGVDTNFFTVFELTQENNRGVPAGIPVAFGARNIGISGGEFVDVDASSGGLLYEFQVGEAEIVADNIHGTDVEDGVTTSFVITNLPTGPDGAPVGFLLIDRGDDNVIEEIVGPGFSGVPITVQTGDSVFYFLPQADFADRPAVVTFNYYTTDSDGLNSLGDGPATVTINLPDPVPTVTATDASVDEDDIEPFVESNQQPGSDIHDLGAPFDPIGSEPTNVTGTIAANFGFDQPGTIGFTQGTIDALNALNLTSSTNDLPLEYALSNGGLTLIASAGFEPVFAVTLSPGSSSGSFDYSFDLVGSINHPLTDDPATADVETKFEDPTVLPIQIQVTDLNGDSATGTFNVTIDDDVPTIAFDGGEGQSYSEFPGELKLWESDIFDGGEGFVSPAVATQDLRIVFGADGPESDSEVAPEVALSLVGVRALADGPGDATADPEFAYDTDGSTSNPALKSGGEAVSVAIDPSDPTVVYGFIDRDEDGVFNAGDTLVFQGSVETFDSSDPRDAQFTFELYQQLDHPDAGEVMEDDNIRFEFSVTVTDDDGDSDVLTLTVDVDDDGPSIPEPQMAIVDEDGLPARGAGDNAGILGGPGDIPDPQPAPSGDGNEATFSGTLGVDFGTDKPGDIDFAALDGQPVVDTNGDAVLSHDRPLTYSWDAGTHTLSAVTPGGDGTGGGTGGGTGLPGPSGNNLVSGLGGPAGFGENTFAPNDDGSVEVDVTSIFGPGGMNFFGTSFTSIFINNNGNITFDSSQSTFTPFAITGSTGNPIIAPYFADVDTRPSGDPIVFDPAGNSTGSDLVYWDMDTVNGVMTITWDDVGFFGEDTSKTNAFQLRIFDNGSGNFSFEFRYEDINWTTGDASSGTNGLGGTIARAGWSSGDGVNFFELPQAGDQAQMLALEENGSNVGVPGVWQFGVVDGGVVDVPGGTAETIFELEITDVQNGDYTLTLLDQLDHAAPIEGGADENDILLDLGFTVTDFDGDTADGILPVRINDDSPTIADVILTHDETPGVDADADDVDAASKPANLQTLLAGLFGGVAPIELSTAAQELDVSFGADGPGGIALDAIDEGAFPEGKPSGLFDTATDAQILLFNGPGNTIVGKVGAADGPIAFVVYLESDNADADLWFVQYSAIVHDNPSDPDEANPEPTETVTDRNGRETTVSLFEDESFEVTYTATDFDGDAVQGTATITIEDDGPTIIDGAEGAIRLVHDESAGQQTSGLPTATEDNNDDDLAPAAVETQVLAVEAWVSLLQGVAVDLTAIGGVSDTLVEGINFDAGADGLGAVRLDTSALATGTPTGLFVSADGSPISYVVVNGGLVLGVAGYAGSDINGRPVFDRIVFSLHMETTATDLGAGEAEFTFAQYEAVVHPLAGDGSGIPSTFDEGLASGQIDGRLNIGYVVEDGDGDTVTATGDARIVVDIEDDGPRVSGQTVMGTVEEEQLAGGNEDTFPAEDLDFLDPDGVGPLLGDLNVTTTVASGSVAGLVSFGADQPGSFSLSPDTSGLPALTSVGEALVYSVTGNVLTGYVDSGLLADTLDIGDRPVFTLELQPNGTYSFTLLDQLDHPVAGIEDILPIDFSSVLVATDADGDTVTFDADAFTIKVIDDVPVQNGETAMGVVEEEQLALGNEDISAVPDLDGDTLVPFDLNVTTTVASGSVAGLVSFGADQPGSFSLSPDTAGLPADLTSQGGTLVYDVTGNTLTAYVESGAAGGLDIGDRPVFTLELQSNGAYSFTLLDQLDHHPAELADNIEGNLPIDFSSVVVATDFDGDAITLTQGTLVIKVIDDTPLIDGAEGMTVTHDETPGIDLDADDTNNPLPTGLQTAVAALALLGVVPIGSAQSAAPVVSVSFGADEPGGLSLTDDAGALLDGVDSGLQRSSDDLSIFLFTDETDPRLVHGRAGATVLDAEGGDTVFLVFIDDADNTLWVSQFEAVEHPIAGDNPLTDHDDTVSVFDEIFVTATDFDGDAVTTQEAVTVAFQDDGPSVASISMINDETPGLGDATPSDDTDLSAAPDAISAVALGLTPINVSAKAIGFDYGADGPGGIALDDVVDGTDSGLIDTATGTEILLFNGPDDTVLGKVGGADGPLAFASVLGDPDAPSGPDNGSSADLYFAQYRAIQHDNPFDPDEAGPEGGAPVAGDLTGSLGPTPELDIQGQGYTMAVGGTGLLTGSGTIAVEIGGPIVSASLYWTGRDFFSAVIGDPIVTPLADQMTFGGVDITADRITGTEINNAASGFSTNNIGYAADVTTIVSAAGTGMVSFDVLDGGGGVLDVLNGAGLLIVYVDPTDPSVYRVTVFEGLDFALAGALPDAAATVTDPITFSFDAAGADRTAEVAILVGDAEADRSDRIEVNGTTFLNQLDGDDGADFDADVFDITIAAGTTETSVQLFSETNDQSQSTNPDSMLWAVGALRVEVGIDPVDEFLTLNYTVTDADGDTAGATATITIEDDGPIANDDGPTYVAAEVLTGGDVLTNDTVGVDGDIVPAGPLTQFSYLGGGQVEMTAAAGTTVTTHAGGELTVNADGTWTYQAPAAVDAVSDSAAGFVDDFTYVIKDGDGDAASATQSIRVVLEPDFLSIDAPVFNVLGGGDDDFLAGSADANLIVGLGGNDLLFGGGGDDILVAGAGNDQVFGDGGADTFSFNLAANEGTNRIGDFSVDEGDRLEFTNVIADVDGIPGIGAGDAIDVATFSKSGSTVTVDLHSGTSLIIEDVNGAIDTVDDLLNNSVIVV